MPAPLEDHRYFVVNGRRWRKTDPGIPEPLRTELVRELMSARRVQARQRVQDAKVALGERGRPWWETSDELPDRLRLAAAMRTLLRARAATSSICPSDAARVVGAERWRSLVATARDVARDLARAGDVVVTQGARELDLDSEWRGPVRIRSLQVDRPAMAPYTPDAGVHEAAPRRGAVRSRPSTSSDESAGSVR